MDRKKLKESLSQSVATSVELGLTPSNGRCVYDTHSRKVCRFRIGDRKMAENLHGSRILRVIAEGKMSLSQVTVSL